MAATPSTMAPLGTRAPDFSLPDHTGAPISLSDFENARGLLVAFICYHCPFVAHIREELARSFELDGIMQEVKTRADKKDPSFYAASRYNSPAEYYKDYLRLSGILLWADNAQLWANKQARPGLPSQILRLVRSLVSGGQALSTDQATD